jgi:hypothetical protein
MQLLPARQVINIASRHPFTVKISHNQPISSIRFDDSKGVHLLCRYIQQPTIIWIWNSVASCLAAIACSNVIPVMISWGPMQPYQAILRNTFHCGSRDCVSWLLFVTRQCKLTSSIDCSRAWLLDCLCACARIYIPYPHSAWQPPMFPGLLVGQLNDRLPGWSWDCSRHTCNLTRLFDHYC